MPKVLLILTLLCLLSCNRSDLCVCTSENLETGDVSSTYFNPNGNEGCEVYTQVSGGYRTDCGYNKNYEGN